MVQLAATTADDDIDGFFLSWIESRSDPTAKKDDYTICTDPYPESRLYA
jgi:hypothetical protein